MENIWYLGNSDPGSTSFHRANALKRLGYNVVIYDPYLILNNSIDKWLNPIHYRTGYRLVQEKILNWCKMLLNSAPHPTLIWVNGGELLGEECLKILRSAKCPIVLYNNDDPTGGRDGRRFDSLLKSLPYYDICAVMRQNNVQEFLEKGAKKVYRVSMSYDEVAHKPFSNINDIPNIFRSDVVFIGTWMKHENRDKFILTLLNEGINISIWGGRWQKSPYWKHLKNIYKGNALSGREYVAAIQGSKICLGLLSKGNRDLHTQRTFEIPYAGGLLCAERTFEHLEFYRENTEALFWSDVNECATICKELLSNNIQQESIRKAGMKRVRELHVGNEDICNSILKQI